MREHERLERLAHHVGATRRAPHLPFAAVDESIERIANVGWQVDFSADVSGPNALAEAPLIATLSRRSISRLLSSVMSRYPL